MWCMSTLLRGGIGPSRIGLPGLVLLIIAICEIGFAFKSAVNVPSPVASHLILFTFAHLCASCWSVCTDDLRFFV